MRFVVKKVKIVMFFSAPKQKVLRRLLLLNEENAGRVKIRPAPNSLLMLLPTFFSISKF